MLEEVEHTSRRRPAGHEELGRRERSFQRQYFLFNIAIGQLYVKNFELLEKEKWSKGAWKGCENRYENTTIERIFDNLRWNGGDSCTGGIVMISILKSQKPRRGILSSNTSDLAFHSCAIINLFVPEHALNIEYIPYSRCVFRDEKVKDSWYINYDFYS